MNTCSTCVHWKRGMWRDKPTDTGDCSGLLIYGGYELSKRTDADNADIEDNNDDLRSPITTNENFGCVFHSDN